MMLALAVAALVLSEPPTQLQSYLSRHRGGFAYRILKKQPARTDMVLVSQTWQGVNWKHDLIVQYPPRLAKNDTAILVVTGDRVDAHDLPFGQALANRSRLPVATLFKVPNQPIFDKVEDDLIAHTFGAYLETGNEDWPLLFPMVKSVRSAMDALRSQGLTKFIVTGASKRGWTTWLVGATKDPRVVGLAPVVFDNLKFEEQLQLQMTRWGKYSEMIGDYVGEGLTEALKTSRGQQLARMVDPHSYLPLLRVPVFAIFGSNDRYWSVDSHALYWKDIPVPKSMLVLPNQGHTFAEKTMYIDSLSSFARARSGLQAWPQVSADFGRQAAEVQLDGRLFSTSTLWYAESDSLDFRDSQWREGPRSEGKVGVKKLSLNVPQTNTNMAAMVITSFRTQSGETFSISSPVKVRPKQ